MASPRAKSLRTPQQVRQFPNGKVELVSHEETTVGRFTLQPGWRWSRDVAPISGTRSCQIHHQGVVLRGRLRIAMDDGETCEFGVEDVYDIPPGHDAWVVGDEPCESIEFSSARTFAMPADGDRVLASVLVTDIVDSTVHLNRLGDGAWREILLDHNHRVRQELNTFRGREIQTTGDGFLAVFDGPARAVRCGHAISQAIPQLGISVRAGVHTGEVEVVGNNVRGLVVHEAARVAGAAKSGEVLISAATKSLLSGANLAFESAGNFELKGLDSARELFRLVAPA